MSNYPSPVFKDATINGGLTVNTGATVRGGLTVPTGATTLTGGATVNAGLTVASGVTTLSGGAAVAGGQTVTGGLTVSGGLTVATGATGLGAATAATPATGNDSTSVATTAFVNAEITNNLPGGIAALAFGGIGTYACAKGPDNTAPGVTVAGNLLTVFNSNNATSTTPFGAGTTWRYMGSSAFSAQGELWLRVS